ncbi:hypothetical protein TSUD_335490 [Trifolium subterraneum]|uniref:Uncharacterized protein n=1 Tax=Trifolium subterraneum TaxID=3900 RepID=A0A2Z6LN70_TRISU|nr:hypothetical protein TSUD_335490 [Trifolium subterraneum]
MTVGAFDNSVRQTGGVIELDIGSVPQDSATSLIDLLPSSLVRSRFNYLFSVELAASLHLYLDLRQMIRILQMKRPSGSGETGHARNNIISRSAGSSPPGVGTGYVTKEESVIDSRIGHLASTKKPPSILGKGSKNYYTNLWDSLGRGVKTDGSVIERR